MADWQVGSTWRPRVPDALAKDLEKVAERNRIKRRTRLALKMRHKRPVRKRR